MKRRGGSESGRLSCRIDPALLEWVRWHATQQGTSLTKLITDFFLKLRETQEMKVRGSMEQL